jgi:chemotaxis protein MotB
MSEQSSVSQEIIIVRRNNGDGDGGHHGGAWKIAYADFVTAMMAFFLVMWLVNSANEVTKSRVASYFNPIKMTDASASSRGLKSPTEKKTTEQKTEPAADEEAKAESEKKESAELSAEEKLMENPFAKMDEIVMKSSSLRGVIQEGGENSTSGDPFDPKAWEALRNGKLSADDTVIAQSTDEKNSDFTAKTESDVDLKESPEHATSKKTIEKVESTPPAVPTEKSPPKQTQDQDTIQLETTIKGLVDRHKSELDISVDVRKTDEGLLIKLGDNSGKGMFAIGSAEPSAGLIEIVGVIGKLLSEQPGDVVVRGHTDGRQYKSGRRDNWQLSTTRAHMASYMLIRGGLDETRLKSIEGYGAATPLLTSDPNADANRRVEFLLQTSGKVP